MFNLLPLSERKSIVIPRVYIEPDTGQPYGGYYHNGANYIVVVDFGDEKLMASTLAHEFRHACQLQLNQISCAGGSFPNTKLPYELQINEYFNKYPHEMDALLFEYKHAKSELNEWWLKHLVSCKNLNLLDASY